VIDGPSCTAQPGDAGLVWPVGHVPFPPNIAKSVIFVWGAWEKVFPGNNMRAMTDTTIPLTKKMAPVFWLITMILQLNGHGDGS